MFCSNIDHDQLLFGKVKRCNRIQVYSLQKIVNMKVLLLDFEIEDPHECCEGIATKEAQSNEWNTNIERLLR